MQEVAASFADIKKRLNEIADQVSNADLPLEEALTLYEEAVNLGLHATNLLEEDITEEEIAEVREDSEQTPGAAAETPASLPQHSDEECVPTTLETQGNGSETAE